MIIDTQPSIDDLMQFMYLSSTGLVQTDSAGTVTMLNPRAVSY